MPKKHSHPSSNTIFWTVVSIFAEPNSVVIVMIVNLLSYAMKIVRNNKIPSLS